MKLKFEVFDTGFYRNIDGDYLTDSDKVAKIQNNLHLHDEEELYYNFEYRQIIYDSKVFYEMIR